MDVAALSLSIDSSEVVAATKNLEQFAAASGKASTSSESQSGSIAKLVASVQSMDAKLAAVVSSLDKIGSATRAATAANDNMVSTVTKASAALAAADSHVIAYQQHIASLARQQADANAHVEAWRKHIETVPPALTKVTASSGSMRAGMQQLSFQLGDVATQFSMGAAPMQIFAAQASQVVGALGLMTNGSKGLIGFLGGPWGQIIIGAATVLGTLAAAMWDTKKSADAAKPSIDRLGDAYARLAGLMGKTSAAGAQALATAKIKLSTDQAAVGRAADALAAAQKRLDDSRRVDPRGIGSAPLVRDVAEARQQLDYLRQQVTTSENLVKLGEQRFNAAVKATEAEKAASVALRETARVSRSVPRAARAAIATAEAAPDIPVIAYPEPDFGRNTIPDIPDVQPMQTAMTRLYETMKTARLEAKGFFLDWIDGVRNGENVFSAFANSISKTLNSLIDQMIEQMLNQMLGIGPGGGMGMMGSMGMGGLQGGAAGILGTVIGTFLGKGIVSLFGGLFANGGTFGAAQRFANGGTFTNQVISDPTLFKFAKGAKLGLMGESGPEAIMPLKRGPNGALGVQANGDGGRSINVEVHHHNSFAGAIGVDSIVAMNRQASEQTKETVRRELQSMLHHLDQDGTMV